MYEIVNVQYTGTYNNGGTSIPAVLGEFRASSASALPAQNVDCHIICGCDGLDIATGDRYIWNGTAWILQPSANAWENVYTKSEIDSMITEIYGVIAYYHTVIVSDTGEITFYALAGYIGTWTIYGNGQQTGTPTPDNPVMPEFVGVSSENMAILESNSRTINNFYYYDCRITNQLAAGTYTISFVYDSHTEGFSATIGRGTQERYSSTMVIFDPPENGVLCVQTVTLTDGECIWARFLRATSPSTFSYSVSSIRVEKGSNAYGYKIPISCAGQTTPVYLGQAQTVRKIRKLILTGTENWIILSGKLCIARPSNCRQYSPIVSTHFIQTNNASNPGEMYVGGSYINFNYNGVNDDLDDFKAYLAAQYAAGTPVTIWYVLAEPETGIVNEPLAKIGDYADELHSEDADVSIPTVNGANLLTVDTELKPSRIEIQGGIMHE